MRIQLQTTNNLLNSNNMNNMNQNQNQNQPSSCSVLKPDTLYNLQLPTFRNDLNSGLGLGLGLGLGGLNSMNMSIITNSSIDMNNINLNHSLSPLSTHKHDPQFFSVSGVNEHQIISENDIEYYSGSTNGHINHSTGYGTEESGQVNNVHY